MHFFQLLFAANYSLLIKLRRNKIFRHLNRPEEDFSAMLFVILTQFYLLIIAFVILIKAFNVNIDEFIKRQGNPFVFLILFLIAIWIYFGNKYFVANRERRNFFINMFDSLSEKQRRLWKYIALFFMLVPVWFLIGILLLQRT